MTVHTHPDRLADTIFSNPTLFSPLYISTFTYRGTWVETQRVQYKRLARVVDDSGLEVVEPNKRLNQERLTRLAEIGFCWSAKNKKKTTTTTTASSADSVGTAAGLDGPTAPIPTAAGASGPPKKPAAAAVSDDATWQSMYQRLVEYREKFGNCLVPRKYPDDPRLAQWVDAQRVLGNQSHRSAGAAVERIQEVERTVPATTAFAVAPMASTVTDSA